MSRKTRRAEESLDGIMHMRAPRHGAHVASACSRPFKPAATLRTRQAGILTSAPPLPPERPRPITDLRGVAASLPAPPGSAPPPAPDARAPSLDPPPPGSGDVQGRRPPPPPLPPAAGRPLSPEPPAAGPGLLQPCPVRLLLLWLAGLEFELGLPSAPSWCTSGSGRSDRRGAARRRRAACVGRWWLTRASTRTPCGVVRGDEEGFGWSGVGWGGGQQERVGSA